MYNKLFTKILDSSIWLEPTTTRLIWLTMIAAMDEDGFVQFASVANLAHRARIDLPDAEKAVECLESPDPNTPDDEHEGRRIERVPGGWVILNAGKYRDMVTRTISREKTRLRVARHRQSKKADGNASVTPSNAPVTPSEADTDTRSEAKARTKTPGKAVSESGLKFADWFRKTLPDDVRLSANWRESWGRCYDDLLRLDRRTRGQVHAVCKWAREDEFWRSNFMSPLKLREKKDGVSYFDRFAERANGSRPKEQAPDYAGGF